MQTMHTLHTRYSMDRAETRKLESNTIADNQTLLPVPHRIEVFDSGDVSLSCRRVGKPGGEPLIFVHGLSFFSYDWIEIAASMGGDREAIALDMRGFGDSSWSAACDYSVPTMAGDLVALIQRLGQGRAVLVGHSMGGRSVAYCAAKNPALVSGVVLVDYSPENAPAGSKRTTERVGGQPDIFESVEEVMRYHGVNPASDVGKAKRARFEAYVRPKGSGVELKRDLYFRDQFKHVLRTGEKQRLGVDMWQILAEISCPTLVIRGKQSDMFAAETLDKVRNTNSRIRIVEIDGGHNVAGDNPTGFVNCVRQFVNSLEEHHVDTK